MKNLSDGWILSYLLIFKRVFPVKDILKGKEVFL